MSPLSIDYSCQKPPNPKIQEFSITLEKLFHLHNQHLETGLLKGTTWYSEESLLRYFSERGIDEATINYKFPFHDCLQCMCLLLDRDHYRNSFEKYNYKISDYETISRWFQRIGKYVKRFKDNELFYITAIKRLSNYDNNDNNDNNDENSEIEN